MAASLRVRKGSAKKYQILNVIGEGAYGVVLKCRRRSDGVLVAVKKFKPSDDTELLVKTANREVKALRKLARSGHPNIVGLIEIFKRKEQLYIVLEFAERSFLEVLEENPEGMQLPLIQQLLYQLASALQFCHEHRIVHRDVKPENLLLDRYSNLRLCDFGFAKNVSKRNASRRNSEEGSMTDYVATRWYRSPELLLGSTSYGLQVDMWAMGCIMAEMVTGMPLFPGETEIDQLFLVQKLLGPLVPEHLQMFLKLKRFSGLIFPDMSDPETVAGRFGSSLNAAGVDLMTSLLQMVDTDRPTTTAVMQHPFFVGYKPKTKRPSATRSSRSKSFVDIGSASLIDVDVAAAAAAAEWEGGDSKPNDLSPKLARATAVSLLDSNTIRTKSKLKKKKLTPLVPVTPGVALPMTTMSTCLKAPVLSTSVLSFETVAKAMGDGSSSSSKHSGGSKGLGSVTRTQNRGAKYPGSAALGNKGLKTSPRNSHLANKGRSVAKAAFKKRTSYPHSKRASLPTHAAAHSTAASTSRKPKIKSSKSLKLPTAVKFRR